MRCPGVVESKERQFDLSSILQSCIDFQGAGILAATVSRFCYDREKDSGGGGWPGAHGALCKNRILKAKFKEFLSWRECMEATGRKHTSCTFPNMDFSQEDDEAE
jgi:hypothetical protein